MIKSFLFFIFFLPLHADHVKIYMVDGQSNATFRGGFHRGIREVLESTNENFAVVESGRGAQRLSAWILDGERQGLYKEFYFNEDGTGRLETAIAEIEEAGDTWELAGLFWWQGESNRREFESRRYRYDLLNLISLIEKDSGTESPFPIILNAVQEDERFQFNSEILITLASNLERFYYFDTQTPEHYLDPVDIHGYDHFRVGQDNAELLLGLEGLPERTAKEARINLRIFENNLAFKSETNRIYLIESSENLIDWTLFLEVLGTGENLEFPYTQNTPKRYFKISSF